MAETIHGVKPGRQAGRYRHSIPQVNAGGGVVRGGIWQSTVKCYRLCSTKVEWQQRNNYMKKMSSQRPQKVGIKVELAGIVRGRVKQRGIVRKVNFWK